MRRYLRIVFLNLSVYKLSTRNRTSRLFTRYRITRYR